MTNDSVSNFPDGFVEGFVEASTVVLITGSSHHLFAPVRVEKSAQLYCSANL